MYYKFPSECINIVVASNHRCALKIRSETREFLGTIGIAFMLSNGKCAANACKHYIYLPVEIFPKLEVKK